MATFQTRLKELKDEAGKTQTKIAEKLGITPQAFSYYINGRQPDYDTLIGIARYFGVSVDYLLGASDVREIANEPFSNALGLHEFAINYIKQLNSSATESSRRKLDSLNLLLSDGDFDAFLHLISTFIFNSNELFDQAIKDMGTVEVPVASKLVTELMQAALEKLIAEECIAILKRARDDFESMKNE